MENIVVIFYSNDIPAALEISKKLDNYRTYVFDPTLYDKVIAHKFSNIRLITFDNCLDYPELVRWSHTAVFDIERALDAEARVFLQDISIYSWQHHNLLFLLYSCRWFTDFWNKEMFDTEGAKLHLVMYDNPSESVFPSFIPSLLLMQKLRTENIVFSAYTYGKKSEDSDLIPNLCGSFGTQHSDSILVHIPTCLYDHAYIDEELSASEKYIINMQSKNWDIRINASETVGLMNIKDIDDEFKNKYMQVIDDFSNCIANKLENILEAFIVSPAYRTRQCEFITNSFKSQLVTYYLLQEHFKYNKPSKILLSEHDTGFHGPIISFASQNNIPVLLVPHSKSISMTEYHYNNMVAFTHPIQNEAVFNGDGKRVPTFKLAYPERFVSSSVFPKPIKIIGLLLNGFALNGVYSVQYRLYMDGIIKICQWCKLNNIELRVRCRPGLSMLASISAETGLNINSLSNDLNMTLIDFANSIDLCLMYDTPTSAALDFLSNSVPILNPTPRDISCFETPRIDNRIIPSGSVNAIIHTLETFVSDTMNLHFFRNKQFKEYLDSFDGSYPLRYFL